MFDILPRNNFPLLRILLIQVCLKFIMYNEHKCSNCQKGNLSQILEPNCQDCALALPLTIITRNKSVNFSA